MTVVSPKYRIIITYDIMATTQSDYMQFALGEFVPGLQALGLYMMSVYHVAFGDYPSRHIEFVSESWEELKAALDDPNFERLESQLQQYIINYNRKVVHYRRGFQL